mgnify:CR=1 FL=1
MTVRQSLLAILAQGPCYGYQLRAEFDRRTGSTWPLNVGQIYNTLDRLERDGLVSKGATDEQGHVYYAITDAGSLAVSDWLTAPVPRGQGTRDELAIKLAVAATLPGVDVTGVIRAQRAESQSHLDALVHPPVPIADTGSEALARAIVADAMIAHAEAELRWLDRAEQRLGAAPRHTMSLATDRPKRGRPAKAPAA